MKSKIKLLMIILTSLVLSSACGAKDSINIGYIGDLTGNISELGVSGMYGAEMAVKEINESGGINGRELKLIIFDDENDSSSILSLIDKLLEEKISGIVGPLTSAIAEFAVPYINEKGILMISPTVSSEALSNKDDLFFRVIPTNKYQGIVTSKNMLKHGITKAAVIYEYKNKYFTEILKNEYTKDFSENGGQVVSVGVFTTGETTDYKKLLDDAYNSGANGIFIIAPSYEAANFCQVLSNQDYELKVYLPTWAMTNDLLKSGGKSVEGVNLVNSINFQSQNEDYLSFSAKFLDIYGLEPTFSSIFSFESVNVLAEALKNTNMESNEMKKYILNKQVFNGVQGEIIFNEFGDIKREMYVYKIIDCKFEVEY